MITIYLSKLQALGSDPRAIQQIHLIANLDRAGNTTMSFIIEQAKLFTRNCKSLVKRNSDERS